MGEGMKLRWQIGLQMHIINTLMDRLGERGEKSRAMEIWGKHDMSKLIDLSDYLIPEKANYTTDFYLQMLDESIKNFSDLVEN